MIDVSSPALTPLQVAVALLVERRGNAGRRVCELCREVKSVQKNAIVNALNRLVADGVLTKINGDVIRYYAVSVGIPPPRPLFTSPRLLTLTS